MSHANALTPLARLRLARLIVDQGWPVARAAERYDVSWPTAKRCAERYAVMGQTGWATGPRARTGPRPAPGTGGAQDRACGEAAAGPGRDRRPGWSGRLDGARGAGPVPAQPAVPCASGQRRTGPPLPTPLPWRSCGTWTSTSSATSPTAAVGGTSVASRDPGTARPPPTSPATAWHNPSSGTALVHTVLDDRHRRVVEARR